MVQYLITARAFLASYLICRENLIHGIESRARKMYRVQITCKVKSRHLYQTVWTNISLGVLFTGSWVGRRTGFNIYVHFEMLL